MAVDNTLSPHGGNRVERIASPDDARHVAMGLPQLPVSDRIAREVINLSYGFFSPLDGFMIRSELDSVVKNMTLTDGLVWSIPIVFDISRPCFGGHAGLDPGDYDPDRWENGARQLIKSKFPTRLTGNRCRKGQIGGHLNRRDVFAC